MLLPLLIQNLQIPGPAPFKPTTFIPIGMLVPSNVVKVTLKPPYTAIPRSSKGVDNWLEISRPRGAQALYRSVFFGYVLSNSKQNRTMVLRVPDMRTINVPGLAGETYFLLELPYDKVLKMQYFQPKTPLGPEVTIMDLNRSVQIGEAGKFKGAIFIPTLDVLIS